MPDDQTLQSAMHLHAGGDWPAAEAAYRHHINQHPQDGQGWHLLGFLLQQQARWPEALILLQEAIRHDDNQPLWHFNLGIVLLNLANPVAACAAFRHALALTPAHQQPATYHIHLGVACQQAGDLFAAEQAWLQARAIAPAQADIHYLLSALYATRGRDDDARQSNYAGMVCEPAGRMPLAALVQAWCALGQPEQAEALLLDALGHQPDDAVAQHLLAVCRQQGIPARCSDGYVQQSFDELAMHFDDKLGALDYRGPALAAAALAQRPLPEQARVLDLGCGTGLIGEVLRPMASHLHGVDLSAGMLAQARKKGIYDALSAAEIGTFLQQDSGSYALICCMDTLIYIGDVSALFASLPARLDAGAYFLFTIEVSNGAPYQLRDSGRYAHDPAWITQLLRQNSLQLCLQQDVMLRQEAGVPLNGQCLLAQKI